MTNTIKIMIGAGIAGLVMLLLLGVNGGDKLGAVYEITEKTFAGGIDIVGDGAIEVDGTDVISASGSMVAPITRTVYDPAGDVTLTTAHSGAIIAMATAGQDVTLPAASAAIGAHYTFVVTAAVGTTNMTIVADPADTFEGSLIVAGAVVTCDAGDLLTFVIDGENIGDYVEVYSDGTSWLVGDSGVLTASKLTCSG